MAEKKLFQSGLDQWLKYQILWADGHRRTIFRARTDREARQIARDFAIAGGWVIDEVNKVEQR